MTPAQPRSRLHVRQPCPGNHAGRVDAGVDEGANCRDALIDAHRQRLACRAERRDARAALLEEFLCVGDVKIRRHRQVVVERRQDRDNDAAQRCRWVKRTNTHEFNACS
jgi:hypothetical protein